MININKTIISIDVGCNFQGGNMNITILWEQLRAQQLHDRDTKVFEHFDKIFFQQLIISLRKYQKNIVKIADIPSEQLAKLLKSHELIDDQKHLTQLQTVVLHQGSAIEHLIGLLSTIYERALSHPGSFTLLDPDTYPNALPKQMILKELLSKRIARYNNYLGDLQTTDPQTFRLFTLITHVAQQELAIDIFNVLVMLLPHLFSASALSDITTNIASDILANLHNTTAPVDQYNSIWAYLKQASQDSSLNLIYDLLQSLSISRQVGRLLSDFFTAKLSDVDPEQLTLQAVEMATLMPGSTHGFDGLFFSNLVTTATTAHYNNLDFLLSQLQTALDTTINPVLNTQVIDELLEKISLMTPTRELVNPDYTSELDYKTSHAFIKKNVTPIIINLRKDLIAANTIGLELEFAKLRGLLDYSSWIASLKVSLILSTLERKIELVKSNPTFADLKNSVLELNQTIDGYSNRNFLGIKSISSDAKPYLALRADLLDLLQNLSAIVLKAPVPSIDKWDSFLSSDNQSPLYKRNTWLNFFQVFPFTNSAPRFSAKLADQLKNLFALTELSQTIDALITAKKDCKHLNVQNLSDLADQLQVKAHMLNAYIVYLQASSIKALFDYVASHEPYVKEVAHMQHQLNQWIESIVDQARANNYQLQSPPTELIECLIKHVGTMDIRLTPTLRENRSEILATLQQLKQYFYLQRRDPVLSMQDIKVVHLEKLNLFRRILLSLIKFYEDHLQQKSKQPKGGIPTLNTDLKPFTSLRPTKTHSDHQQCVRKTCGCYLYGRSARSPIAVANDGNTDSHDMHSATRGQRSVAR